MIMPFNTRTWPAVSALLIALAALVNLAPPVYADAAPKWTDQQLVGFSDVIVRGRVARIIVAQDDRVGSPYTYVSLDVADVLKGSVSDRRLVLKQLGGRIGATALEIAGQPSFSVGEDVLVFLETRPRDRTLTVTAQWQGKFTVTTAGTAVRQDPAGAARGIFSDEARPLAEWLTQLRGDAGGSAAPSAGAIDVAPQVVGRAALDATSSVSAAAVWRDANLARQAVRVDGSLGQLAVQDNGESQLRRAADFWSATGVTTLATGGLQAGGCFTARAPDGRISVSPDTCDELDPNGGTVSLSGGWVQYTADASGRETARFLGAGVITNRGETATRLLARPGCFEQLLRHDLGHALGLLDSPDGAGVMSPTLQCSTGLGATTTVNNATRPTFVPLQPGASSARRVDALDAVACTVGCDIQSQATITSPAAPQGLSYTLSGSTLTLSWSVPLEGDAPASYIIEAGSTSGATDVASFSTGSSNTSFVVTVGGSAVFYVRVKARSAAGVVTPASNEIIIAIGGAPLPPDAPTGLTASASGSSVTLQWTAPATGGTPSSYIIEAGSNTGLLNLANFSTGSSSTTFATAGVPPGTYFVRVRAANGTGTSAPSNEVVVIVGGACVPPSAPSNLAATTNGTTVSLTWTAGANASSYQLQAGSSPGATNLVDVDLLSPATSLTAAAVSPGTYFVRLRAKNACSGLSGPSNEVLIIVR